MLNLWAPSGHFTLVAALLTAFALGMVHGVTPDEHTWPITFSYSVGSYSVRGGMKAGFLFSLAFIIQRALAAEIAYFALAFLLGFAHAEFAVYIVIGTIMALSGMYILRLGRHVHWLGWFESWLSRRFDRGGSAGGDPRGAPAKLALVHGFIAGWGTGAFALIVYTVLVPQMPSGYVAFLPGLMFGLGTMVMQILFGAVIGLVMTRLRVAPEALPYIGRKVSGMVLFYGGLAFVIIGAIGLVVPIDRIYLTTGLHIHNLHTIGVGFFLAVVVLFFVAAFSFWTALRDVRRRAALNIEAAAGESGPSDSRPLRVTTQGDGRSRS